MASSNYFEAISSCIGNGKILQEGIGKLQCFLKEIAFISQMFSNKLGLYHKVPVLQGQDSLPAKTCLYFIFEESKFWVMLLQLTK